MVKPIKRRAKGVMKPSKPSKTPAKAPSHTSQEQEAQPLTLEDLSFLSAAARRVLADVAHPKGAQSEEVRAALVDDALDVLKRDLEGQPADHLELTLDWLREVGAYPLSLELLEEAWSAELSLELLGRVAQDWVGTALFGMRDERGAREVARHITPRAIELGASFCGDLCDLLLEWGLHEEATPLARFVADAQPGDLSARFHLGVCAKLSGDFELARESFKAVARQHPKDPATLWNLGVTAVALHDWAEARSAWGGLGFGLPEGEGDYASPGELSPVRLRVPERTQAEGEAQSEQSISERAQTSNTQAPQVNSEVLWGLRICPARVKLTSIPYHHPEFKCGDVLLIDGVKAGEVEHQGQRFPISPVISRWARGEGETIDLIGPALSAPHLLELERTIDELGGEGWVIAHWTRTAPRVLSSAKGALLTQLTLYVPSKAEDPEGRFSPAALREQLMERGLYLEASAQGSPGELYHPRWAELTGEDPALHAKRRARLLQ
jgi:hypothetical protein